MAQQTKGEELWAGASRSLPAWQLKADHPAPTAPSIGHTAMSTVPSPAIIDCRGRLAHHVVSAVQASNEYLRNRCKTKDGGGMLEPSCGGEA